MGLINRFNKRRDGDPTGVWQPHVRTDVEIDAVQRTFNGHSFGADFEEFTWLGRASAVHSGFKGGKTLVYAASGLEVEFGGRKFCYVACYVAPDENLPEIAGLEYALPRLIFPNGSRVVSAATNAEQLQQWLGEPSSKEADDQETILEFDFAPLLVEFEMNRSGLVKRVSAWLKE